MKDTVNALKENMSFFSDNLIILETSFHISTLNETTADAYANLKYYLVSIENEIARLENAIK